jgi:cytochrome P450
VLHRHQAYWEEPEQFRPERFLDETAGERPRYAYMPFGGGPRVCIGASFSLMEAVLILGTYAQRMKLRVINTDEVMPQARIVMRPSVRLKAETLPRTPKAA